MAHKAPKNRCYSQSQSADFRFSSTACSKNDRAENVKNTALFVAGSELEYLQRALKAKLASTKTRRNTLVDQRQTLRKKSDQTEGIQYQPNCGFEVDIDDLESHEDVLNDNVPNTSSLLDASNLVFFDLETSGFEKSADILQIAAKCGEHTFCEYANPSQPITWRATDITGMRNVAGELFLHDKKVQSIPIEDVLRKFMKWLAVLKPCILIAHNAKFDVPRLLHAFKNNSMIQDAKNLIAGFADTLVTLRKLHPQRKGPGMFKLSTLAADLLHIEPTASFHEASYDVEILEKLASTIPKENLIANSKSFKEWYIHEARLQKAAVLERTLSDLKGVISAGMIKKIARTGIDLVTLQTTYTKSGREGIIELLSTTQMDKKPRVTKDKKILEKIILFLKTEQSSDV